MKKLFLALLLLLSLAIPGQAVAQDPRSMMPVETTYSRGTVVDATEPEQNEQTFTQEVTLRLDGGKEATVINAYPADNSYDRQLGPGDSVVVSSNLMADGTIRHTIVDHYRLNPLLIIAILFAALVVIVAGKKGFGSLIGLGISLAVILFYIVPQILGGADPLFIAISGSLLIMIVTIYLAHGFSQRTTVAVASTFVALVITGILASGMVQMLGLQGLGSEDAYMLQFQGIVVNLRGLLLGGIIIGTLGVLDDITTAQAATVYELAKANAKLTVKELFTRGFRVGREHITSLVNTLVLAYAGASLPLFLFFVLNPLDRPLWLILNSEIIVEEIARTLAGSVGLILAVPITTILAAFFARYTVRVR